MNYALKFLREELNRERSYARQFYHAKEKGRKLTQDSIFKMNVRVMQNRIPSLEIAIAFLKKKPVKPEYRWTPNLGIKK